MTIFAILMPRPQPALAAKIKAVFNSDALSVNDTQWLISASGTAMELCVQLGIYDPANQAAPAVGEAIVFSTSGYFGRAPANVWEWMKAKLEIPPRAASA